MLDLEVQVARLIAFSILLITLSLSACGGGSETCVLGEPSGCGADLVCEAVTDGQARCFAPIHVEGRVFDLATNTGIVGARVVAIDANGAPVSTVVESGANGAYSLPVPTTRDTSGGAVAAQVTLRADAQGYLTFPTAPRLGIPVELSAASDADGDGDEEVVSSVTDIGLIVRMDVGSGVAIVRGTVEAADPGGVLVVAVQSERTVASAITADDGSFVLFDVPTSTTAIEGYRANLNVTAATVSVSAPETTGVQLTASTTGLSTVTGSVQIVNAPGGLSTSVILVLESTFVEATARGQAPPGLRVAPVEGAWSIAGVAPGEYVALAAFENDLLVRDPDTSIAGTEIVHFVVPLASGTVDLGDGFKVTEALAVISPGAETVEVVTTGTPTLEWSDDSSEDGYELRVYDAFGRVIWENLDVPRVTGAPSVQVTYAGPTLANGMVYQFRAWSWTEDRSGARVYKSVTEDLLGVFEVRR